MKTRIELLCTLALLAAPMAAAQTYPVKPMRLIVPFAAGGGTDLTARIVAQRLTEGLGQPVIVENRAGAGGLIGAEHVARAAPDGYTLLMGTPGPLTISPNLQKKMPFDPLRDFSPVSQVSASPFVLVVHPSLPVRSVKDLLALAKARPGQLNYGSPGTATVGHLAGEQFMSLAKVNLQHIPYKGSAPAMVDLISGNLHLQFENLPAIWPHMKSGKVRAIGAGSRTRSSLVPDLPTIAESGVPGYECSTAFGVLAPAKTPPAVISRLAEEIAKVLRNPEVRARLLEQGLEAVGGTPQEYSNHIRDELTRIGHIVKTAKITID